MWFSSSACGASAAAAGGVSGKMAGFRAGLMLLPGSSGGGMAAMVHVDASVTMIAVQIILFFSVVNT